MPTNPPADLVLTPAEGKPRTLREQLAMFHLVLCAVDPYARPSAWIVETAARILTVFEQADCRVGWLVTGSPAEARSFLGRWAKELLTFTDPDRTVVRALGLGQLPALVHLGAEGTVVGAAEGWNPPEWRAVTANLAKMMRWSAPIVPSPRDPGAFAGTPA